MYIIGKINKEILIDLYLKREQYLSATDLKESESEIKNIVKSIWKVV